MSLAPFSIIVAMDGGNGIAKNGTIPWKSQSDSRFFRDTTMGRGRNAVIMGRVTYESIPTKHRPLFNRHCVVISRTWKQENHPEISVCESLLEALSTVGASLKNYEEIFVAGGEQIYNEVVKDYMYLCKRIYVTKFKTNYDCDQYFPWDSIKDYNYFQDIQKTQDYLRYYIAPGLAHQECQYLNTLRRISEFGESKPDRTGTGTVSYFGERMEFDISERIPIITTKKVRWEDIIKELLFFISGKTNTKILEEQGVNIWKKNTSEKFLEEQELDYEEGDIGSMYGWQWRHWGAEYKGMNHNYDGEGIDQLSNVIKGIRDDPHSRRHLLSCWNVADLSGGVLAPCHFACQFNVSGDRKFLDCQLYQRSADMFLGVPYNITSYCVLTYMIAQITGLRPRKFVHVLGDAHIYNDHQEAVKRQLSRTPRPFPTLKFRGSSKLKEIDDFTFDSFIVEGYRHCDFIKAKMSV